MAKQKDDASNKVQDSREEIAPEVSPVADAPVEDKPAEVAAPVLPDGHVWVDLIDSNGLNPDRRAIPKHEFGAKIGIHDGVRAIQYRHVSDAPDGVWQFMI